MKTTLIALLTTVFLGANLKAEELSDKTSLRSDSVQISYQNTLASNITDTTKVRIGTKNINIIDHPKASSKSTSSDDFYHRRFVGSWRGIDFGFLSYTKNMYVKFNSTDLKQPQSNQINLNIFQSSIGLQRHRNSIGIVTGAGLRMDNYKFANPYTFIKGSYGLDPVKLDQADLKISKLFVNYLTVPLLLEIHIPVDHNRHHISISAGLIGNVRIGSHTKVKFGHTKEKYRSDFNLRPFNFTETIRLGYRQFGLFMNYDNNYLLKGNDVSPILRSIAFGIFFNPYHS